jgi:hypothetical protein
VLIILSISRILNFASFFYSESMRTFFIFSALAILLLGHQHDPVLRQLGVDLGVDLAGPGQPDQYPDGSWHFAAVLHSVAAVGVGLLATDASTNVF